MAGSGAATPTYTSHDGIVLTTRVRGIAITLFGRFALYFSKIDGAQYMSEMSRLANSGDRLISVTIQCSSTDVHSIFELMSLFQSRGLCSA